MSAYLINPYLSDLAVAAPTFVGVDATGATQWSDPSIPKLFSIGGSNRYGTAGYFQICPGSTTVFQAVGTQNDLGATLPVSYRSNVLPPSNIDVFGGGGTFVNFPGYPSFKAPDGSALVRSGALSVSVSSGPFNSPSGSNASYYGIALEMTFKNAGKWRVGVAVDTVATGQYAPDYVAAFAYPTNTIFSTLLSRNGIPKLVLFDIEAAAGAYTNISMWQNSGTNSVSAFSLLTFDVKP
jgi:hypothetical protein